MTSHWKKADERGGVPGPDVTVVGAGLTGAMLATVLARGGVRVLLVAEHDDNAGGGEMTLPCTSFLYELIAERYRVPEVAILASADRARREVSGHCAPQRTLGFTHHRSGVPHSRYRSLQFNVPSEHGESQLYRPDTDAWMLRAAVRRGADVRHARLSKVSAEQQEGVRLVLDTGEEIRTGCVVDTGTRTDSPVAQALGVRRVTGAPATRMLGAHVSGALRYEHITEHLHGSHPWSHGSLHHVLDGGCVQVGHFGAADVWPRHAGLSSVTLCLDAVRYPDDDTDSDEWSQILSHIDRYPSLSAQLSPAVPLRTWQASRLQWRASPVVGDGMLLLDAAAFGGDPLFGRDLYVSAQLVYTAAADLLAAARDEEYSAGRFRYVERLQRGMADRQDRLTGALYAAMPDFGLFNAVIRVWLLGTMFDALSLKRALTAVRGGAAESAAATLRCSPASGACHTTLPEYRELLDLTVEECRRVSDGETSARVAADRIFLRLRHQGIAPPIYGFDDPADLDYVLTLRDRLRAMRWLRRDARPAVRALLGSYGLWGGGRNRGHDG